MNNQRHLMRAVRAEAKVRGLAPLLEETKITRGVAVIDINETRRYRPAGYDMHWKTFNATRDREESLV